MLEPRAWRACKSCISLPTLYQSSYFSSASFESVAPVSGPSAVTGGGSATVAATASAIAFGTATAAAGLFDTDADADDSGVGSAAGWGAAAEDLGAADGWKTAAE